MNKEALLEAGKELARVVVLAVVPVLITSVELGSIDWKVVGVTALIALLRGIDKYFHLLAPEGTAGGLTRF